jgi:hypothetical protein
MQSQNSKSNVQERNHTIKRRAFALKICFLFFYVSSLIRVKFERILFSRDDVVNSFLLIEESLIARSRDRFQNAKNINKRRTAFETFINREFFQFERVKMKIALNNQKEMTSKIKNVIHQADFAFERERKREREQARARKRARKRERVSIIVVERKENLISAVDEEERERERERKRSRERRRRDRKQTASK